MDAGVRAQGKETDGALVALLSLRSKIHILGSFQNIKIARDAVVSLIMGAPPGKVYAKVSRACFAMLCLLRPSS